MTQIAKNLSTLNHFKLHYLLNRLLETGAISPFRSRQDSADLNETNPAFPPVSVFAFDHVSNSGNHTMIVTVQSVIQWLLFGSHLQAYAGCTCRLFHNYRILPDSYTSKKTSHPVSGRDNSGLDWRYVPCT